MDLGPQATRVILRSHWAGLTGDASERLELLEDYIEECMFAALDDEGLRLFGTDLAAEDRAALYRALPEDDDPRSLWFALRLELARLLEPAAHLAICGSAVGADWSLAIPVLEDCLARYDWRRADEVALQAWRSFHKGPPVCPEEGLAEAVSYTPRLAKLGTLLGLWRTASEQAGETTRGTALRVQIAVLEDRGDWDRVLLAFGDAQGYEGAVGQLWKAWLGRVSSDHRTCYRPGAAPVVKPWPLWLLDFERTPSADGLTSFRLYLDHWLTELGADPVTLREEYLFLFLLLQDLNILKLWNRSYPRLSALIDGIFHGDGVHSASRRRWLQRLGPEDLVEPVFDCLRRVIVSLVPDPATAHRSHYDGHALWLAAVSELNGTAAARLYEEWRRHHGRRINLWKAVDGLAIFPFR